MRCALSITRDKREFVRILNGSYLRVSAIFIFEMYRSYYFNRIGWWVNEVRARLFQRKLSVDELSTLENLFPYYQRLNPAHKSEFRKKLELVLTTKEFIGRGGIEEVTSEMEILIGATIVQVTFGWKKIRLLHFDKILIYPNAYYSSIQKAYHRGEVNPKLGLIVVSWRSFLEGLTNENDGINLGIHEIAHALKLENKIYYNGESEFFNQEVWTHYQQLSRQEIDKINAGITSVFRDRAGENEHEFFAVALETFFERPAKFKAEIPVLYQTLVKLLRQDPLVWIDPKSLS